MTLHSHYSHIFSRKLSCSSVRQNKEIDQIDRQSASKARAKRPKTREEAIASDVPASPASRLLFSTSLRSPRCPLSPSLPPSSDPVKDVRPSAASPLLLCRRLPKRNLPPSPPPPPSSPPPSVTSRRRRPTERTTKHERDRERKE